MRRFGTRDDLGNAYHDMLNLRHRVFRDRLGWTMPSTSGSETLEEDEYDHQEGTMYVTFGEPVAGCCRIMPTTERHMLPELWPQLLPEEYERRDSVWELSRLAVDHEIEKMEKGFARILDGAFVAAVEKRIEAYVIVTGLAIERLLKKTGVNISRLSKPCRIDGVMVVGSLVRIDTVTRRAIDEALSV